MSGNQTARGTTRRETIQEFMARRAREVASFGGAAEAAAYEAVKKAIRTGQDYRLMTPGEVMSYGAGLVRHPQPKAASPAAKALARAIPRGLDDSATAKAVGGRWTAEDLGWDGYGPIDRLNYGTSPFTKAVVGPVLVGGVAGKHIGGDAP